MELEFKNKKTETICLNLNEAKKLLNKHAIDLHALINILKSATCLDDIAKMKNYHLHPYKNDEKGRYSLDVGGRKSGWRLFFIPLDSEKKAWVTKDLNLIYKETKIILILEVGRH